MDRRRQNLPPLGVRRIFQLLVLALAMCTCGLPASSDDLSVIAYYHGSNPEEVDRYPIGKLTHVIYSFLYLDGSTLSQPTNVDDRMIRHLVALKARFPQLKVQVAFGGWGGCEACSEVFAEAANRDRFAASVLDLHRKYGIDGFDLDWEYPAIEGYPGHRYRAEDTRNFTLLIRALRRALPDAFELSFAAGAHRDYLESSVEWEQVMPLVDRVNLMTYDLVNGYSTITGHHTALYSTARQKESVDHAVTYLLDRGIAPAKIVIGAAFYARVWEQVQSADTPLYQAGVFKETVNFRDFNDRLVDGFLDYWDPGAQAPYKYSDDRKEFATYDDTCSVALKVAYAADRKLGGIMFWQLAGDRPDGGLLESIGEAALAVRGTSRESLVQSFPSRRTARTGTTCGI